MKVEVITIGDEVVSGTITDTNFAWLGDRLWSSGFEMHWHTSVRDEPEDIQKALKDALGRSQAVIVTGGLGPTLDDITLESAAQAFGLRRVTDEHALAHMKAFFDKLNRTMSPNNAKQALLPEGSRMIPNHVGTAPGCHLIFQNTHFFFLPGVPREMKSQIEEDVLPMLFQVDPDKRVVRQKIFRCFGAPEATLAQKLEGVDLSGVDLAYRLSFPEIFLKVSAWGPDPASLENRIEVLSEEMYRRLGDLVYSEGLGPDHGLRLPAVIGKLLLKNNATLSVAESCTGGHLANLITDVPGSSRYFDRGLVTYSNASKIDLLSVPSSTIEKFGAVSSETAIAMARGVRLLSKTTYSLAITGIAGPDGGTPEKPVGTVHIALDSADQNTIERKFHFPSPPRAGKAGRFGSIPGENPLSPETPIGRVRDSSAKCGDVAEEVSTSRDWFKQAVSYTALDLLRKRLLRQD